MFVLKTTSFRGIRLKLTGTLRIKWVEMEAGSAIPYEEFESLLYENLDIFTPNLRDKDARWIFPGKHVYKFSYKLPTDLPYTLDGSRYGRVEYKSKAELLIPAANPVESQEEEFILRSRCLPEVFQLFLENCHCDVLGGRGAGEAGGDSSERECGVRSSWWRMLRQNTKCRAFHQVRFFVHRVGGKLIPRMQIIVEAVKSRNILETFKML